jgi:hypothetical protein
MGMRRCIYRILVGKLVGKSLLEDPDVDGRIVLRWIFMEWDGRMRTELSWLRVETGVGHL